MSRERLADRIRKLFDPPKGGNVKKGCKKSGGKKKR